MKKFLLFLFLFIYTYTYTFINAEPFNNNDLFMGKTIKLKGGTKTFSAGVEFQIAPVKALIKSQMDKIKDEACKSTQDQAACNAQVDSVLEMAKYVPEDAIKKAVDDPDALKDEILKSDALTEEQKNEIQKVDFSSAGNDKAIDLLAETITDKERAITFTMEPFLMLNFDLMEIMARVPIASFYLAGDTTFALGNVDLDAKFGHILEMPVGALGLSYGSGFYLPTGSKRANALALSNIFLGPRYYHEYLTIAPYVVAGYDLLFLIIQAEAEIFNMIAVRDNPIVSYPVFLKYGLGVSLVPLPLLMIVAEVNGLANIKDAKAMNGIFLTGGIKLNFAIMKFGAAAQIPIMKQESDAYASFGGLDFGSPASINVIVNASIDW